MVSPEKLLELLEDKQELIKYVLNIMDKTQKQSQGLTKLRESISRKEKPNLSQENIIKCLQICMRDTAELAKDMSDMSSMMLVLVASGEFDQAIAKFLVKMGRGEEALQSMLKNKMK